MVDQHSYQAAQIARKLMEVYNFHDGYGAGGVYDDAAPSLAEFELQFKLQVIQYALDHDEDEAVTGDTPSPSKPRADSSTLSKVELVVKCADILEAIVFLEEEAAMGNRVYTDRVLMELRARFHEHWQLFPHIGVRPITSDVIKWFVDATLNPIHPAMEK